MDYVNNILDIKEIGERYESNTNNINYNICVLGNKY